MILQLQTKHLIIPYIIGIGWFLCHPIISVVTGELKCRGIYTDEHQLDVRGYNSAKYQLSKVTRDGKDMAGSSNPIDNSKACDVLNTLKEEFISSQGRQSRDEFNPFSSPYITCHNLEETIGSGYSSIVQIRPSLAPTNPVEALVLVIPYTSNWFMSDFHSALLNFTERMVKSSWLAKDILIISPNNNSTTLEDTVKHFMEHLPSFPISLSKDIIRQLVVLKIQTSESYANDQFIILTQGDFGTVPNLDLVAGLTSSIRKVFGRNAKMTMHPFDLGWWKMLVHRFLPKDKDWQEWGIDLGNMIAFMATFWIPTPHAGALAQGIDSVTIIAKLRSGQDISHGHGSSFLTVTLIEHLFRGLNSLSERLHHNVNQYLLPSSNKFVSHGEYIIPAILIMLPLVLRVLQLLLRTLKQFHFKSVVIMAISASLIAMILASCQHWTNHEGRIKYIVATAYIFALSLAYQCNVTAGRPSLPDGINSHKICEIQSIQLMACMVTLYMHVPLALSHFSLFMVSSLFWVPILAFFDYGARSKMQKVPGILMLVIALLVYLENAATVVLSNYMYVCLVAAPLHFLAMVLSFV